MTKPSYEEHDCGKYCDSLREKIDRQRSSLDHSTLVRADLKQKLDSANRELARVRGLLQRATDLLQRVEHSRGITLGQLPKDVHEFLANEGAESADIGKLGEPEKLNNAQKCVCGHPRNEHNLVTGACANAVNHGSGKPLEWCKCKEFAALAESSLSSQPTTEDRWFAEATRICHEIYGDTDLAAINIIDDVLEYQKRAASPELLPTKKA